MKRVLPAGLVLIGVVFFSSKINVTTKIFDETFIGASGKPTVEVHEFQASPGRGVLLLTNGDHRGSRKIVGADVKFNGQKVFSQENFSPQVQSLEMEIDLTARNQLQIEHHGAADRTFRIEILPRDRDPVIRPGATPAGSPGSLTAVTSTTTDYMWTACDSSGETYVSAAVTVKAPGVTGSRPGVTFGAFYEDLIPVNASAALDPARFAVVTGNVRLGDGTPLEGVKARILGRPEYGSVVTCERGNYSIPVEGGGTMNVVLEKDDFLTSHRKVAVPWNGTPVADPAVMVERDSVATKVIFDGNPQTIISHRSSTTEDSWGSRSCSLVFTGDTKAFSVGADGSVLEELGTITVRATEYPTLDSMPAQLPPLTAYTYCVELAADGVERIVFDRPVVSWVENFLGFDVGERVPSGYYDRDLGVWVPSADGYVVRLLDTNGDGRVDALDRNGNGFPDDMNGDGNYRDEVSGLSDPSRYPPGSEFWRVEITHFTPWDYNWPYGPPADAVPPNPSGEPDLDGQFPRTMDCERHAGSYVEDRGRIVHENIPVPGTDLSLHYASNRVEGYRNVITVPASGDTVPESLKRINARVEIAGRVFEKVMAPVPGQKARFIWDGLDHLGRKVSGGRDATVSLDFVYEAVYLSAGDFENSFGQAGGVVTGVRSRQEVIMTKRSTIHVGSGEGSIAEGWTLSPQHSLNLADTRTLYKGDGTVEIKDVYTIETVAGDGFWGYSGDGGPAAEARLGWLNGIAVDAAGNIYFSDNDHGIIRVIGVDGVVETAAGKGIQGYAGDGGPAVEARLNRPGGLTVDHRGNLFVVDSWNNVVRMVDPEGIITTAAGNGSWGFEGDGGPATEASLRLDYPFGISTDSSGNLYIADSGNHRIRKVDPAGIITTVAGNGAWGYGGDGGPATEAMLFDPHDVATDSEGNLYIADNWNCRVRRVDKSGVITTVAGDGTKGNDGDGGPATQASITYPTGLSVDSSGNLYILDQSFACVRKVDTSGIITTVAGDGTRGYSGDDGPAPEARLNWPSGIAVDPEGNLYIADSANYRIRKVGFRSVFAGLMTVGDMLFPDGSEGHVIGAGGLHKKTMDLETGVVIFRFCYDDRDRLKAITDRFGNRTTIRRGGNGVPVSITSQGGLSTALMIGIDNMLERITFPDGGSYDFEYDSVGLMTAKTAPEGNRFERMFDSSGRLTDLMDQEGGHLGYWRHVNDDGSVETLVTTAEGNLTSYLDRVCSSGARVSTVTGPAGAETRFSRSADGMAIEKSTTCGMGLSFRFEFDPVHQSRYLGKTIERSPSGLEKVTSTGRDYDGACDEGAPDRIFQTVTVNGNTTSLENDIRRSRKKIISPEGRTATSLYDPATLLKTGLSITGLHGMTYRYDGSGRLLSIRAGTRETSFSYDARGFLELVSDPAGRITTYEHDSVGRLTGINRPDGTRVRFAYDMNGNLTFLYSPSSVAHGFGYDAGDRCVVYRAPLGGFYSYLYDNDRRLVRTDLPSGKSIENTYDDIRLTRVRTPEGSIDFNYLCGTKVESISSTAGSISFGYDGKLVASESTGGVLNQALGYTYNDDFRLSEFSYAGGTCNYFYDDDGLLIGAGGFAVLRDAENGLPGRVTGGALHLVRNYNGHMEIESQYWEIGNLYRGSWALFRDDSGMIKRKEALRDNSRTEYAYAYDKAGRLLTVARDGVTIEEYRYGAEGARTSQMSSMAGLTERTFTYSEEGHLLTAGTVTYHYDCDGFLVTRVDGADTTHYGYSTLGELLNVVLPDGVLIGYRYDPLGRRIAREVDGVPTEKYLWNGMSELLAVYDGHDNLRMRFEYADGAAPLAMVKDGRRYYFVHDQLGSITAVVDSGGNVVKSIGYDSFGNRTADTAPNFKIPLGFAGGLYDPETGLTRFGLRDYDPETGRWTAKDPMLFAGGDTDLYSYCINDPVNMVDGKGGFPVGLAAGAVGGSVVGVINLAAGLASGKSLMESLKNAAVSGATACVSIGLAGSGAGFFPAGAITVFSNILLQKVIMSAVNIESALYSGFVTSAGGFALGRLDLRGALFGLLAGQVAAPVGLVGEQVFPGKRTGADHGPCP